MNACLWFSSGLHLAAMGTLVWQTFGCKPTALFLLSLKHDSLAAFQLPFDWKIMTIQSDCLKIIPSVCNVSTSDLRPTVENASKCQRAPALLIVHITSQVIKIRGCLLLEETSTSPWNNRLSLTTSIFYCVHKMTHLRCSTGRGKFYIAHFIRQWNDSLGRDVSAPSHCKKKAMQLWYPVHAF